MAKMIHKQNGLFGETVYLDENYRMIGSSRKGLFGEEVFLDKDLRYAGSKQKGLFGEEVYLDKDYHVPGYGRKGLGNTRIYVDRDGHYAGWGGKGFCDEEVVFVDEKRSGGSGPVTRRRLIGAWIFLAVILGLIIWFVASIMR